MHKAFRLNVTGLLIRDEWDITWSRAEATYAEGVRNLIIIGQTGIGVHQFPHISLYHNTGLTMFQAKLFLFSTFFRSAWPRVCQLCSKPSPMRCGSSTRAAFASLAVGSIGQKYRASQRRILIGPSSIQIGELETLPPLFTTMDRLSSSCKLHRLVMIGGVGQNTMELRVIFIQNLSRWGNYWEVRTRMSSVTACHLTCTT